MLCFYFSAHTTPVADLYILKTELGVHLFILV